MKQNLPDPHELNLPTDSNNVDYSKRLANNIGENAPLLRGNDHLVLIHATTSSTTQALLVNMQKSHDTLALRMQMNGRLGIRFFTNVIHPQCVHVVWF